MKTTIAFISLVLFLVFNSSLAAQPLKKIMFSAKGAGESMLPFVISERLGFYREEGVKAEVVVTRGTIASQALIGGSVGYTNANVLPAILNGARLKTILNNADKPAQYLVSSPKISSLKQLPGKTVAISDFSGNAFLIMKDLLARTGVSIADIKLRVFGEANLRLNALLTDSVDATMLSYEQVKRAQAKGYRLLAYSGDYISSSLSPGLCTTDARIKELPDEVYRVVRATLKGQLFWYRNPETTKFLMEALAVSDESEAKEIWEERVRRASDIAQGGRATEEAMATNLERVKEQMRMSAAQAKGKDITVDQVYDFSFVKRAHDELVAQKWDPLKYRYVKKISS
jgi:ABC-type nitrate/sulfonate/bicarbonate transport system substrate-binding protein